MHPSVLIIVVGSIVGLWFLVRFLATQGPAQRVGVLTMAIGAVGIVVSSVVLMICDSPSNIELAVLISGAIVFGCGSIATAIGRKTEQK